MDLINRLFAVAMVSACLTAHGLAAEPKATLDGVLAKWEAATAKIKTLDAKVYRWRHDLVFSTPNQAQREEGRFYYEGPRSGCLQFKSNDGPGWNGLAELYIWHESDLLIINGQGRTCQRFVWPVAKPSDSDIYGNIVYSFRDAFESLRYPKNFLPFTVDVRAAECRNDYVLTLTDQDERLLIMARRKKAPVGICYSRIEALVDPKSNLTTSIRCFAPNGKDYMDWMFEDMKINERPRDRDQLLSPDLHGLTVQEFK